jgi:hypothetical protein
MAGSNYERILAAEWLVVMAAETLDSLSGTAGGAPFSLPDPSKYFATMVVFLMLSAVAMFGESAGKLAAAFGGVAGAAILLTPSSNGKSPVVGAVTYFGDLFAGGPSTPAPANTASSTSSGTPSQVAAGNASKTALANPFNPVDWAKAVGEDLWNLR